MIKKIDNKVLAIVGPTGSGKTAWAKKIVTKFPAAIISADSRQVYRGMDIGTGKDRSVHQDLIDIVDPDIQFTLHDFQQRAKKLIQKYHRENLLPVVVGGTGLYIEALLGGYVLPDLQTQSEKLRSKLDNLSTEDLIKKLQTIDPDSAARIDPHNKRRIIRALEVSLLKDEPFSKLQKKEKPPFRTLLIGIKIDRETLYSRIDARVERMIKDGLVEEVRGLLKKYRPDLPAFNSIGYKEIIDYLEGKDSLKDAIQKIKNNTHDFVRRQETWFRKNKDIRWVENYVHAEKLVQKFLVR